MAPKLDMSAGAIVERLRKASGLSDLAPERRLEGKIDMAGPAITARLREASDLFDLCRTLAKHPTSLGKRAGS